LPTIRTESRSDVLPTSFLAIWSKLEAVRFQARLPLGVR
jgi:hypothetical protein